MAESKAELEANWKPRPANQNSIAANYRKTRWIFAAVGQGTPTGLKKKPREDIGALTAVEERLRTKTETRSTWG